MQEIIRNIQVHVPLRRLLNKERLQQLIAHGIHPEIGFSYHDLDGTPKSDLLALAARLAEAGRRITFHAPFMDLRPGAMDPMIRRVTRERLEQVFELVPYFNPLTVVCHPSFDERYYVSNRNIWLENSIETWSFFADLAEKMQTVVTLENVYETDPEPLTRLLASLKSPRICFCFDTGHFNAFARSPLGAWVEALSPYLYQIHIHDNGGTGDDHSPVGEGTFPFAEFFAMLNKRNLSPLVTIEAHSEKDLWKTLQNIKDRSLLP